MPSLERISESARALFEALREDAAAYCEDRSPWVRAALGAYLAYATARHVFDPLYRSWFAGITLAFHEIGHILFAPLGRTMMLLGGSITQLVVPLAAGLYLLLRQRDWFGLGVCQAWLGFSAYDLATYVGDANKELLPLVSMGGTPEHDWSALLTQWHLLNACDTFATLIRVGGFVTCTSALALMAWLLVTMHRAARGKG